MGENYPIRDKPASSTTPTRKPPSSEPMSLAAFMGGRATGPRLTKQAPQPDAHDPTQFQQRTVASITAPHPIFGRGGIALPGMARRHGQSAPGLQERDSPLPTVTVDRPSERDRKISTPVIVTPAESKPAESVSSQLTGRSNVARDRTLSTPAPASTIRSSPSPRILETAPTYSPGLLSRSPIPTSRSPVPTPRSPITPTNQATTFSSQADLSRSTAPASPVRYSQATSPPITTTRSSSPPKQTISTPSLVRPIQPTPRHSLGPPQMPASLNPSPAFLRTPTPKEPTPSISRLQGRGFVKSIVDATTAQFGEVPAGPSSPTRSTSPGKRDSAGAAKKNVLDRWQFAAGPNGSPKTSPPIISPKPIAVRKSGTFTDSASASEAAPSKPGIAERSTGPELRSMASFPSLSPSPSSQLQQRKAPDDAWDAIADQPGLGSSTTMISYIKPTKTGDAPAAPASQSYHPRSTSPSFDELGVRMSAGHSMKREPLNATRLPASSSAGSPGKPLSHVRISCSPEQEPMTECPFWSCSAPGMLVQHPSLSPGFLCSESGHVEQGTASLLELQFEEAALLDPAVVVGCLSMHVSQR